eukprot:gnl/MRDRNA2_/MRDRNA2_119293_c0_seq1.p1 gnl/MRDRNA2_/MRDRNA2_119293_c0~~gnl/MRDRNA2_/MRDRNA2_119293_c0_seq1.p1  ORF type:complete len:305 (+),score=80.75 gnl/MRDRNA2_/MRDRNA2_119293_c0_seq1:69-983(+)
MPPAPGERSRSPHRIKFESKFELGSWVLFRDSPKRRWAEANPALISKVVSALQKSDVRCSIIIPNLLTLRHGFGGNHFKEVNDVEMKNVKAYPGSDMSQLKEQLLLAIKNDRAERAKRPKVKVERRSMEDTAAIPMALKVEMRKKEDTAVVPCALKTEKSDEKSSGDRTIDDHTMKGYPLNLNVTKNKGVPLNKEFLLPSTPEDVADKEANKMEDEKPGSIREETQENQDVTEKLGLLNAKRLEDFTRSIARAFGRQSMITRQELLIAPSVVEMKLTDDEMAEGLTVLEEQNKIFVSNDLIFAI